MKKSLIIVLAASAVLITFAICLAELEPCDDYPIEVYNVDPCGISKWVMVEDSLAVCQLLCLKDMPEDPADKCGVYPSWIGGTVIFDEGAENSFKFDPVTIIIAEITPEGMQTNFCQIAENPKDYDGGFWYVPYNVTEWK